MKILIHIPQLIFGGAEKVLVSFANDLVSRGHDVEIVESYDKGLLKPQFDKRVTFHCICSDEYTKKYYASLEQIKTEKNLFKKLGLCVKKLFSIAVGYRAYAEKLAGKHYADTEYDIAVNYLEIEPPTFILEHIKAKKYIQWVHTDVSGLKDSSELDSYVPHYAKTDAVICVSEYAKKTFVEKYPYLQDKTHVIYNFFDTERIINSAKRPYDFGTQRPILLSVGRLTAPKAYRRFLNILSKLKNEGYEFSYHIVGGGDIEDELKTLTVKLNLSDTVTLHGVSDNPYKYMSGCDLFVLPSEWEGFPTVTVEAKLIGMPVFATNVSGISEQLIHRQTGYIVDNSEQAIYTGLKELLDHPNIISTLSDNSGIERITDNNIKYEMFMRICNI